MIEINLETKNYLILKIVSNLVNIAINYFWYLKLVFISLFYCSWSGRGKEINL